MQLVDFSTIELPRKPFVIAPISDIQYGVPSLNAKGFLNHLDWVRNNFEDVWYLGLGDYIDFMSPTNRESVKHAKIYDTSRQALALTAENLTDQVYNALKHTSNRWLGMVSGHHYWEYENGDNTDSHLAEALNAPYLRTSGFIEIKFTEGSRTRGAVNILAHHGEGMGKNPLQFLMQNFVPFWPEVDIFAIGHFHKNVSEFVPKIVKRGSVLVEEPRVVLCAGGWPSGYVAGKETYVEKAAKGPRIPGGLVLKIHPYKDSDGSFRRGIEVITRS